MAEIRPQPGPQTKFLASSADIVIYGGSAGGGKTWGLLLEPLRHIHNSKFGAVVFRRTYPQITNEGGLWDKSMELYPLLGAKPKKGDLQYDFPSGAKIKFAHLQHDSNVLDWQGSEVPLFLWDELTHFSKYQFFYMLSRSRSTIGIRPYIRGTCNPDADSWLAQFIEWWIDQETGYAIPQRSGIVRYFYVANDFVHWFASETEATTAMPELAKIAPPKSFTFIPASIYDNKALLDRDPGYLANLMALPLVERERLLGGNWKVRPSAGKVFNREWFEVVDTVPVGGVECRFWDFAATEAKLKGDDPDYTASVKMRKVGSTYYILDCTEDRESPARTDQRVKLITQNDKLRASESQSAYLARWMIDPGSAGKRDSYHLATALDGSNAQGMTMTGDKLTKAGPLAAQALVGNVKLLKGNWNERFLFHMHHQPDLAHDDIMDAAAGAHRAITLHEERLKNTNYSTIQHKMR